jgi:hypothetical protein
VLKPRAEQKSSPASAAIKPSSSRDAVAIPSTERIDTEFAFDRFVQENFNERNIGSELLAI